MITSDIIKIANFISSTTMSIAQEGVVLETGSDFQIYKDEISHQPEKGPVMPNFDPDYNNFDDNSAFWMIGRDYEGQIVHTQAVRLLELNGDSLASYIEGSFEEFTPNGWFYDEEKSHYHAPPDCQQIKGNVCCHGEFWLKGGPTGFRGAGMTILTARLAMVVSLMKWSPDFIFALMTSNTICKGLAARAGFMHSGQMNRFWFLPDDEESVEAWAVWLANHDLLHLLNIPPNLLASQLNSARDKQKAKKAA